MKLKIFKGYEQFSRDALADAMLYAMENKEETLPELLEIFQNIVDHVKFLAKDPDYILHFPVIYLLAYFRETRAYEGMLRLASLPDELIFDLLGDAVTEDFRNILASVCDGNVEPIQGIIEDTSLDEYVRSEALEALLVLCHHGMVDRGFLVSYFRQLLNGRLEQDDSLVWDELIDCCAMIHPAELIDDIKSLVEDDPILANTADMGFINLQLAMPVEDVLEDLKKNDDYSFIDESDLRYLEDWLRNPPDEEDDDIDDYDDFDDDYEDGFGGYNDEDEQDEEDDAIEAEPIRSIFDEEPKSIPFRREQTVGRNDPCPCGSGKKYKKCCLGKVEKNGLDS